MSTNPNINPTVPVLMDASAVGRSSTAPFLTVYQNRNPTASDVNYPIQTRWVNLNASFFTGTEFLLIAYSNSTGVQQAVWIALGTTSTVTATLTGNTGSAVGVDAMNNINVVGDGTTISVAGNPGANTLTISTAGTVATTYNEDAGSAIPSAGILRIIGGTGVNTSGAGNTVTINSTGSVPLLFTENSGTATPAANNINVFGGTGITTSGAGSTITINAAGSVATTYTEDAGSATPAANILQIRGGTGISTSGAGNVVTITNTSASALTFNEDSGSATPAAGIIRVVGGTGISTSGAGNTITIMNSGTPSAFFAVVTLAQNNVTGDNTFYTVIFDTTNFDRGGEFNTATGIFTAAATGLYLFGANLEFSGITGAHTLGTISIATSNKNSATGINTANAVQSNDTIGLNANYMINLTAGQTAKVALQVGNGGKTISLITQTITNNFCYFYGFRVL